MADEKKDFEVEELEDELEDVAGGNCGGCNNCSGCTHSGCATCGPIEQQA